MYSGDNYSINTFTLGEAVDRAVPAAYLKQVGGAVLPDELAASRLSPRNATGGTDLYSQNFAWGRNLVSLPGRAGMDLSLGIAYNSLVWTKSGEDLYYDVDRGNAGPGFRLGFPVIEPVYYDGAKAKFAYMMIAPSGAGWSSGKRPSATSTRRRIPHTLSLRPLMLPIRMIRLTRSPSR